jgi:hypothetical protein
LAVSKNEDHFEGPQIFWHCWHLGTSNDHPRVFQKRSFRNLFSSGNTDSLNVLMHKEMILKVIAAISV